MQQILVLKVSKGVPLDVAVPLDSIVIEEKSLTFVEELDNLLGGPHVERTFDVFLGMIMTDGTVGIFG